MPPPRSFWVILIDKTPTSFRAKVREDLVPALRQLQRTQSGVTLRWFERGRIWESPEAAIGAAKLAETERREERSKDWRPGGVHRDPKARFELTRDQKRAKFKRERSPGQSDLPSPFGPRAPRAERPRPERPTGERGTRPERHHSGKREGKSGRAPSRRSPFGDGPPRRESSEPPMENPFKTRRRQDKSAERGSKPRDEPRHPGRPPIGRGGSKPPRRRS